MYIIKWRNTKTGARGQSADPMDYQTAAAWAEQMNKDYPYIIHTVEVY